jgi:hypothetical protein
MEEIKIPDNWEPYEWMEPYREKRGMSILRYYNHITMCAFFGHNNRQYIKEIMLNIYQAIEYNHKYKWSDPVTEEFKKDVVPGY